MFGTCVRMRLRVFCAPSWGFTCGMGTQWPELDALALGPQTGLLDLIEDQLSCSKTIAVVGLWPNPDGPSHYAAKYLQEQSSPGDKLGGLEQVGSPVEEASGLPDGCCDLTLSLSLPSCP